MAKFSAFILAVACTALLAGCDSTSYKKTRSGLLYKIISNGKGKPAQRGNVLKLHFSQRLKGVNKDTLLGETYGKMPTYAQVDSGVGPVYSPVEIFSLLRKGDSAVIIMEVDTLIKKNPTSMPPFIGRKDKIVLTLKVVDLFAADSLAQKDQAAEGMKEQARQQAEQQKLAAEGEKLKGPAAKEIEDYLAKNKIVTQKTVGGTYVEIKEPGTGELATNGKKLVMKYTGKLFPGGKVFESNMDGSRPPLDLVLGTGGVIPGWDEGLAFFRKGGKGTLYIPFFQAYGDRPGPGGKSHENLMFDVEVVDITNADAPAPGAGGAMPPPPPPPGH